jgi:hypothetical protein
MSAERGDANMADDWVSKTLVDALAGLDAPDGDRTSALEMWKAVAEYPRGLESIVWAQAVAKRILEADREADRRRRPDAILRAVGLAGHEDRHRRLRDLIEVVRSFEDLTRTGPPARGEESKRLFNFLRKSSEFREHMRARGLTDLEIDDLGNHEIRKLVDRIS